MMGLFIKAWLALDRLQSAARRAWRRILVGAFLGWLLGGSVGAVALAIADTHGWLSYPNSNLALAAIGWGCLAAGGVLGYAVHWRRA